LIELGEITIPAHQYRAGVDSANYLKKMTLALSARHLESTAVTVTADCLVLIPSQHWLSFSGANLSSGAYVRSFIFENGDPLTIGFNSSSEPNVNVNAGGARWRVPHYGGRLVIAGQRATESVLGDDVYVKLYYYLRHARHGES
jgi:acetyltransferase-like isoleucine patch superfamily enzyme